MMVGSLRHPHPRILPVNRNRGWRLVNLGIYVYFDVEWGRRYPHLFSKEGGGRLTNFRAISSLQVPLAPVVSRVHAKKLIESCSVYVTVLKHVITI